MYVEFKGN